MYQIKVKIEFVNTYLVNGNNYEDALFQAECEARNDAEEIQNETNFDGIENIEAINEP
jgi:hypothetical protein